MIGPNTKNLSLQIFAPDVLSVLSEEEEEESIQEPGDTMTGYYGTERQRGKMKRKAI